MALLQIGLSLPLAPLYAVALPSLQWVLLAPSLSTLSAPPILTPGDPWLDVEILGAAWL
jgi:hypothetical protein